MNYVKPKKSLGQHFLKDQDIACRIASTLDGIDLPVVEVGPGTGVLTRFLLQKQKNLKVIELDSESIKYLNAHFPELAGRILAEDFLKTDLSTLFDGPICVIGNYPYNISSQIFFKVLDHKDLIPYCSGMIQKEVAGRITAKPGNKSFGILSVLIQAWYDTEYLFTVGPEVFNPPPKVQSAVIRLTRNKTRQLGCNEAFFKQIVKTTFNQRRKMLRNSIKPLLVEDAPILADELFNKRPEQLSVQQFVELTNRVEPYRMITQSNNERR